MPFVSGKQAFLEILKDEGVSVMFGNPVTTELRSWTGSRASPPSITSVALSGGRPRSRWRTGTAAGETVGLAPAVKVHHRPRPRQSDGHASTTPGSRAPPCSSTAGPARPVAMVTTELRSSGRSFPPVRSLRQVVDGWRGGWFRGSSGARARPALAHPTGPGLRSRSRSTS